MRDRPDVADASGPFAGAVARFRNVAARYFKVLEQHSADLFRVSYTRFDKTIIRVLPIKFFGLFIFRVVQVNDYTKNISLRY